MPVRPQEVRPLELRYPDPPLAGSTVRLRPWTPGDVELVRAAAGDAYVALIERIPSPCAEDEALAWIERQRAAAAEGRGLSFVVAAGGDAVGGAGFRIRHPGVAELGFWLVPRARGRGLARAAAALLSGWMLDELGLGRLQATVEPWNAASRRVLETTGFVREGLLRGYAYGRDAYMYSLVPGDPREERSDARA